MIEWLPLNKVAWTSDCVHLWATLLSNSHKGF